MLVSVVYAARYIVLTGVLACMPGTLLSALLCPNRGLLCLNWGFRYGEEFFVHPTPVIGAASRVMDLRKLTAQSQHSHSTGTAQSQHRHSHSTVTVTAQSQHRHSTHASSWVLLSDRVWRTLTGAYTPPRGVPEIARNPHIHDSPTSL